MFKWWVVIFFVGVLMLQSSFIIRYVREWKERKRKKPSLEEIVLSLVLNTAALGLQKNQYVELAPIKGTCGNFKLSGNSLPNFVYTVFEKKIMEFIEVRVEVSRPDRIQFTSKIKSTDEKQHGKEVETIEKYKEPFYKLANHLYRYFPYTMDGGRINGHTGQDELEASAAVQG
jgi:hypothetical protein